jgi:hypothetical protein
MRSIIAQLRETLNEGKFRMDQLNRLRRLRKGYDLSYLWGACAALCN